jgi:hypothetical protein
MDCVAATKGTMVNNSMHHYAQKINIVLSSLRDTLSPLWNL